MPEPIAKCELLGCGAAIYRKVQGGVRHRFCFHQHAAAYQSQQITRERADRFAKILEEYFDKFARAHYSPGHYSTVRSSLFSFFEFLRSKGIRSLKSVTPRTITEYLSGGNGKDGRVLRRQWTISRISVFMSWLIHEGHIKGPNPVLAQLHHPIKERRLPRPYTEEQLKNIWRILQKRGDALSRLAVAIGEETGLRISETANIRLPDVDRKAHRIFVRLPNKTMQERWVPYHEKTRRYLEDWLKDRDSSCTHDFLFHNTRGGPMTHTSLWRHLRVIFDGYITKLRKTYDEVFVGFKYHRLRHSTASRLANYGVDAATLMAVDGWRSWDTMYGYVKIQPETVQVSYQDARKEIRKASREESNPRVLSLEEFGQKKAEDAGSPVS